MLIVFIGPDGCGKTTIATRVRDCLNKQGERTFFFELNYGILPRFRDIASFVLRRKIGKIHAPGDYLAGMEQKPNRPLKGALYMIWYGLDYAIGGIRYKSSGKETSVIFARYVYDYAFQRSYSRVPSFFSRLMMVMAPKPDLVFTIGRNPEEIFLGKPELTIEEIKRQQDSIITLLAGKPNFHVLDGSAGIEVTVVQALALIAKQTSS